MQQSCSSSRHPFTYLNKPLTWLTAAHPSCPAPRGRDLTGKESCVSLLLSFTPLLLHRAQGWISPSRLERISGKLTASTFIQVRWSRTSRAQTSVCRFLQTDGRSCGEVTDRPRLELTRIIKWVRQCDTSDREKVGLHGSQYNYHIITAPSSWAVLLPDVIVAVSDLWSVPVITTLGWRRI